MPRRIKITFTEENVSAIAELLEDQAPKTCEAVLSVLPQEGEAHHATYSGSEVVLILDRIIDIGQENATTMVIPGDVAFTTFEGGKIFGFPDTFSEIAVFYARDAIPSMPNGPVPMNIFGRITEGLEAFAEVCFRMRRSGVKPLSIEFIDD
ncbi:MAG: DUF3830 family protein [Thermomicrobiales bacterium]